MNDFPFVLIEGDQNNLVTEDIIIDEENPISVLNVNFLPEFHNNLSYDIYTSAEILHKTIQQIFETYSDRIKFSFNYHNFSWTGRYEYSAKFTIRVYKNRRSPKMTIEWERRTKDREPFYEFINFLNFELKKSLGLPIYNHSEDLEQTADIRLCDYNHLISSPRDDEMKTEVLRMLDELDDVVYRQIKLVYDYKSCPTYSYLDFQIHDKLMENVGKYFGTNNFLCFLCLSNIERMIRLNVEYKRTFEQNGLFISLLELISSSQLNALNNNIDDQYYLGSIRVLCERILHDTQIDYTPFLLK